MFDMSEIITFVINLFLTIIFQNLKNYLSKDFLLKNKSISKSKQFFE